VQYSGPQISDSSRATATIAIFGARANELVKSPEALKTVEAWKGTAHVSLIPVSCDAQWGKASSDLVNCVYQDHVLAIIALDRNAGHLAEQIGVKAFVPVVAISSDHSLTSTNVPWIFRLPKGTSVQHALKLVLDAVSEASFNRGAIRERLASGKPVAGIRFESTGEVKE